MSDQNRITICVMPLPYYYGLGGHGTPRLVDISRIPPNDGKWVQYAMGDEDYWLINLLTSRAITDAQFAVVQSAVMHDPENECDFIEECDKETITNIVSTFPEGVIKQFCFDGIVFRILHLDDG